MWRRTSEPQPARRGRRLQQHGVAPNPRAARCSNRGPCWSGQPGAVAINVEAGTAPATAPRPCGPALCPQAAAGPPATRGRSPRRADQLLDLPAEKPLVEPDERVRRELRRTTGQSHRGAFHNRSACWESPRPGSWTGACAASDLWLYWPGWRWRWCLRPGHRSHLSRDIVHTRASGVSEGYGAAGRHGGPGRGPQQERGRPRLRRVPPLGDHARAAVPG